MDDRLTLTVVTPHRAVVETEAGEVVVPGLNGYLGILPGHAPMFSELSIGRLSYTRGGSTASLAVAGGFVEVLENHVRVLASVAESEGAIDANRASAAYKRAQERLSGGHEAVDYERALRAAHRAASRLEIVGRKPGE